MRTSRVLDVVVKAWGALTFATCVGMRVVASVGDTGLEALALTLCKFETQGSDDGFLDTQDDDVFN